MHKKLSRQEILDLYFVETRHKLIDIGTTHWNDGHNSVFDRCAGICSIRGRAMDS